MPFETAIITDPLTLSPETKVAEALEFVKEHRIRAAPVVDAQGVFVGIFSISRVLKKLLPAAALVDEGLSGLAFTVGAAPGIAKKLDKIKQKPVKEIMTEDVYAVDGETAFWEMIRLLLKYGSPLPIIDKENGKLTGIISIQSVVHDLEDILERMAEGQTIIETSKLTKK